MQAGLALAGACYLGLLPLTELASLLDDILATPATPHADARKPGSKNSLIIYAIDLYLRIGASFLTQLQRS